MFNDGGFMQGLRPIERCALSIDHCPCTLCPRECGADRTKSRGACGCGNEVRVARAALHFYEEPPFSGDRGSGTIFFSGCNLRCVYCQNYVLQSGDAGRVVTAAELAGLMLQLEAEGAHNINLVTPAPHLRMLLDAIPLARARGLAIPILYNTSGYEKAESLRALEGLVDIYLPDFKYCDERLAARFSGAGDYFPVAVAAIAEMFRQVGHLRCDTDGIAMRGVCIRHLVLPGCAFDSRAVLREIAARFGTQTQISLMRQYAPTPNASFAPLNRTVTDREYEGCVDLCREIGLENVFLQDKEAASLAFTPEFG